MNLLAICSGGGTTANAIMEAFDTGVLQGIKPCLMIVDRPGIGAIEKAEAHGIPWEMVNWRNKTEGELGEIILDLCQEYGIDLIGLYGCLFKIPASVIKAFRKRMINQHPGPLDPGRPDFGGKGMFGLRVHCAVLEYARLIRRDFATEAVAQRVDKQYDRGAVLDRIYVEVLPNDTPEILARRVLPEEHRLQTRVLQSFADGTVQEISRDTPIVLSGREAEFLDWAKRVGIARYPKG